MSVKIKYLNDKHKAAVEQYVSLVNEVIYYATEDSSEGKYNEFSELLNTITAYSNNFYRSVDKNEGAREEFAFMIPNLLFYMAIGFLTGIQKKNQQYNTMKIVSKLSEQAQEVTGIIADILIDEEHAERKKELFSEDKIKLNN